MQNVNNLILQNMRTLYFKNIGAIIAITTTMVWGNAWGQVSVTATTGSATGTFTTLKGAFDAINLGIHTGVIAISITANTTETAPAVLNASGSGSASYTSLSIQPSGGAARTISGAIAAGSPMIDFNGADNVTIDGLNTSGNSLTISNTTIGTTLASSTIRFIADATSNTIQNCTIQGSATINGVVFFSTGTTTGNDNNSINNCNITAAGTNYPLNCILSTGSSAAIDNSGNTLNTNNIYDYFSAASPTAGINLTATGNSAWTITNNKLYQTATRTYTTANTHNGIFIGIGSGYTISGNVIGYANSSGTGTMNLVGNSVALTGFPTSYTTTGTPNATRFIAINCAFTAAGANSVIKSNTIAGLALHTSSGAATTNGVLCGINVTAGNVTIGGSNSSDGNIIGTTTGPTSGIYSVFVSSTSVGAVIAPIYATSANTVSIQNNKIGDIMATGTSSSTASGFKGIDVAGVGNFSITDNIIGNDQTNNIRTGYFLTTTNLSNAATTATTVTGVSAVIGIQSAITGNIVAINTNTIKGIQVSGSVSTFTGIVASGTLTGTTPSITINSNNLGNATQGLVTYAVANSGALLGISATNTSTTHSISINSNNIQGITHSVAGTNVQTYINQTGTALTETISNNTLTALNVATTGTIYLFNNNYSAPANGSKTIQNNSVVTSFTRNASGSSGSFYGYYDNGSSPTTVTHIISGNNFSNVNTGTSSSGSYAYTGILSRDFSSSFPSLSVYDNTVNSWSIGAGSGAFIGISVNGFGGTSGSPNLVYGNSISNCTSLGTSVNQDGLIIGSTCLYVNVYDNTINANAINGAGGQFVGLLASGSVNNNKFYNNTITNLTSNTTCSLVGIFVGGGTQMDVYQNTINTISGQGSVLGVYVAFGTTINVNQHFNNGINNYSIYGLSSTGASATVEGIKIAGGTTQNVYQNEIYNLSGSGITSPIVNGIVVSSVTTANIYRNKIYNLSQSGAISATSPAINGFVISAGTTLNLYNNLIGSLTAPSASFIDAIRGISITSTTASASYNVYNNTVYLTGGSAGTNFGTSGIYHTASATATTAALDLQNNMIFNTCTPSGTGIVTAFRRSAAATLGNYKSTSNKNLFYAGTPSASTTIMSDGTNNYQTISTFQTAVSSRDANSFTESAFNPATYFVSTSGSNANYLQPASGLTTQAEGGGNTIALCSPDYNGVTRPGFSGAAYDVGAWEFAGAPPAPAYTNMVPSPALTAQCTKAARVILIDITTASGTITGATLNYNHNGTAQTTVTMTNSSGNTWTGTMLAPSTGNATVTWSIIATNSLGSSSSFTGTSYSDEPNTGVTATASATPSTVCDGSNASLNVSLVKSGTGVIGSGLVSSSSSPTPFSGTNGGMKGQYIILASELISAGYSSGNLTGLGINFASSVTATYTDFTIQIGNTSLSAFNSILNLESGLTTVYGPTSLVNPVAGVNAFTFTTPFNWDGVSNIIISTSWSNNTTTSTSASVITTTTTSNLAQVHKRDSYLPASLLALTGAQFGGSSTVGTARPNFTIIGNQAPTPTAYSWSNGTIVVGTTNPLSTPITAGLTYTATATVNGCPITAAVSPTVLPLPTAPTATNSSQCGAGTPTCSVSGTGSVGNTFRWYLASTGGTAIVGQSASTLSSYPVSASASFYVSEFNGTCESPRTQVNVTFNTPPAISVAASVNPVCSGSATSLSASSANTGYTYAWSNSLGSGASVSASPTTNTTYTVTATDNSGGTNNGCATTDSIVVTTNPIPSALTLSPSSTTGVCGGSVQTISLTSGGAMPNQTIMSENFDAGVGAFTVAAGSSTAAQDWAPQSNGYTYSSTSFTGSTNGFMFANSDTAGSTGTTNTQLTSASFSTIGASSMTLTFKEFLRNPTTTKAAIEISDDNFTTFTSLRNQIATNLGSATSFNSSSLVIPAAFENKANVGIRFSYIGADDWYWAVDEVIITGTRTQPITWSPTTDLYTDAAATSAYTGTAATTLYAKLTANRTYTATSTIASTGCTNTKSVQLNNNTPANNVVLASSTQTGAVQQCTDATGWTYYATTANPNAWIFAINKGTTGMTGETINIEVLGSNPSSTSSAGINQQHGSYLMKRGWDVTGTVPTGSVSVRFFYDPADTTSLNTDRDAGFAALSAGSLAVKTGFEWFKSTGTPYNSTWRALVVGNKLPSSHVKLTPTFGSTNGVNYVEFSGITSFSGGSGGSGFGPPSSGGGVGLPVTWAGFDAVAKESGNDLTWKTASEVNTSHFEVEYSYDGINFNKSAIKVPAAGSSQTLKTYTYTHNDVSTFVYYRIKQVDMDNRSDYSATKLVKRTDAKTFQVSVYPIPVLDDQVLNVEVKAIDKSDLFITILDMNGRIVKSRTTKPTTNSILVEKINVSNLSNGLYQVVIQNGQGKEVVKFSK
jgi:trimeric autotransporter adhesin